MDSKNILRSKTFWTNIIVLMVVPFMPANVKEYFSTESLAAIFATINIVLRLISKDKVTLLP